MSSISFLFIITTELSRTEHVMHKMLNIYTTKSNSKRRISKDVIQQHIQCSCLVGWGGRILGEPHGLQGEQQWDQWLLTEYTGRL